MRSRTITAPATQTNQLSLSFEPEMHERFGSLRECVAQGTQTSMLRGTPMGRPWLNLICRTPAPTQAWVDGEGRVIA